MGSYFAVILMVIVVIMLGFISYACQRLYFPEETLNTTDEQEEEDEEAGTRTEQGIDFEITPPPVPLPPERRYPPITLPPFLEDYGGVLQCGEILNGRWCGGVSE